MTWQQIDLHLDEDGAFRDFQDMTEIIHLGNMSPPIRIAALRKGMISGKTSVAIGLDIGKGRAVLAETSLRLFLQVADMLRARFGDE